MSKRLLPLVLNIIVMMGFGVIALLHASAPANGNFTAFDKSDLIQSIETESTKPMNRPMWNDVPADMREGCEKPLTDGEVDTRIPSTILFSDADANIEVKTFDESFDFIDAHPVGEKNARFVVGRCF